MRTICGIWLPVYKTSWSMRLSQVATVPRPSIGAMHWRAVEISRVILIGASNAASILMSTNVSRNVLSPQCSCRSGAFGKRAASMSCTAGSSSRSTSTLAAISSASARVRPTHIAMSSPTCRTFWLASTGCSDALNPGRPDTATIGFTPTRSAAANALPRCSSGMWTARSFAWASGERTKATSFMPARRISPTNWPRPRRKRSSSLRLTEAPTP